MSDDEGFVSTFAVAELTGKAPKTVRNWARSGAIPGKKQGRDWLFIWSDVRSALKASYVEPPAPDLYAQSPQSRAKRRAT